MPELHVPKRRCYCKRQRCNGWFLPQYENQGNCQFDSAENGNLNYRDITQVEPPEKYEVINLRRKWTYNVEAWGNLNQFVLVLTRLTVIPFEDDKTWSIKNENYAVRDKVTHLSPNGIDILE